MITGVTANVAAKATIPLRGVATVRGDVVSGLQGAIDASDAEVTAEAAFHSAVAAARTANATARAIFLAVKAWALVEHGDDTTMLTALGVAPPAKKAPDVMTKAAAVVKQAATRVQRHTMGKKQKAALSAEAPAAPVATAPATTTKSS
jgi:hypothetical protein